MSALIGTITSLVGSETIGDSPYVAGGSNVVWNLTDDSLHIADAGSRQDISVTFNETLNIADFAPTYVTGVNAYTIGEVGSLLSEAATEKHVTAAILTESLNLTDSGEKRAIVVVFSEQLAISDGGLVGQVNGGGGGSNLSKTVPQDTISIDDTGQSSSFTYRFDDSVGISDTSGLTFTQTRSATLTDSLNLVDSDPTVAAINKTVVLTDSLNLADVEPLPTRAISVVFSEPLLISDLGGLSPVTTGTGGNQDIVVIFSDNTNINDHSMQVSGSVVTTGGYRFFVYFGGKWVPVQIEVYLSTAAGGPKWGLAPVKVYKNGAWITMQ